MAGEEKPQIVREIEEDLAKEGRSGDEIIDPLLSQGEALPEGIKGSEGNKSHVYDVGQSPEDGPASSPSEAGPEDEEFGGITDPSTLTAD